MIELITKEKKYINEIDGVRAIACLSVVLLHSINIMTGLNYSETTGLDRILITFSNLLSFGTTAFIFISGLLLGYSYPKILPEKFYVKRLKYILLPYIFVSFLFAIQMGYGSIMNTSALFILNLFGYSHWFILVIIQFYLLYPLLVLLFNKYSYKTILFSTLILNVVYLSIFNFTDPPAENLLIQYLWVKGYWSLFIGWIFYFAVAYYCGKNYSEFLSLLEKWRKLIFILYIPSIAFIIFMNEISSISFGSKRVDMILFSLLTIFILFIIMNKRIAVSLPLKVISNYSFGIYLLHYLFLVLINDLFKYLNLYDLLGHLSIILLFILSIIGSMFIIFILNKLKVGQFLVGRISN